MLFLRGTVVVRVNIYFVGSAAMFFFVLLQRMMWQCKYLFFGDLNGVSFVNRHNAGICIPER